MALDVRFLPFFLHVCVLCKAPGVHLVSPEVLRPWFLRISRIPSLSVSLTSLPPPDQAR